LRVIAARDKDFEPEYWWTNRIGRKIFLHELLGMLYAMWEVRHHPSPQQTGFLLVTPALAPLNH
jgi:hypothetical protein